MRIACSIGLWMLSVACASIASAQTESAAEAAVIPSPPVSEEVVPLAPLPGAVAPATPVVPDATPRVTVEIVSDDSPPPTVLVTQDEQPPTMCTTPCVADLVPGQAAVQVMRGAVTAYGQHPTTETFTRLVLVPREAATMSVQMPNHALVAGIILDVGAGVLVGIGLLALSTIHGDTGFAVSIACDGVGIVLGIVGAVLIYGFDRQSDVRVRPTRRVSALRVGPGGLAITF